MASQCEKNPFFFFSSHILQTEEGRDPIKERRDPIKERTGPTNFSGNWTLPTPEKCRLATQDILLSPSLLTKPHKEGSVTKMKPLRTSMGAECQDGLWPNHRNQHLCREKQDEIFLDKWPDPQSHTPFNRYALHHSLHSDSEGSVTLLHFWGHFPSLVFRFGGGEALGFAAPPKFGFKDNVKHSPGQFPNSQRKKSLFLYWCLHPHSPLIPHHTIP